MNINRYDTTYRNGILLTKFRVSYVKITSTQRNTGRPPFVQVWECQTCETKHTFSCCTSRRNSQELTIHDRNARKTSLSDVPLPDQDVNILGDVWSILVLANYSAVLDCPPHRSVTTAPCSARESWTWRWLQILLKISWQRQQGWLLLGVSQRLPCLFRFVNLVGDFFLWGKICFFSRIRDQYLLGWVIESNTLRSVTSACLSLAEPTNRYRWTLSPVPALAGEVVHRYRIYPVKWFTGTSRWPSGLDHRQGLLSSFFLGIDWFDSWAFGLDYQALW
jgi:hypothetical protein